LASNGVQETVLASALGMDLKTWRRIRNEDPVAKAAWEEARSREEDRLVGALFQQALGTPAEYDASGNLIRAEQPRYAPASMFLLKARHGYRDLGPTDGGSDRPTININIPAPLAPEQYAKLITVAPAESAKRGGTANRSG
jgi:hypothetical protein